MHVEGVHVLAEHVVPESYSAVVGARAGSEHDAAQAGRVVMLSWGRSLDEQVIALRGTCREEQ